MPGRQPWKVDCAFISPASDMAVVMIFLFDHENGEEGAAGDPVLAALQQSQLPHRVLDAWLGDSGRSVVLGGGANEFPSESSALR